MRGVKTNLAALLCLLPLAMGCTQGSPGRRGADRAHGVEPGRRLPLGRAVRAISRRRPRPPNVLRGRRQRKRRKRRPFGADGLPHPRPRRGRVQCADRPGGSGPRQGRRLPGAPRDPQEGHARGPHRDLRRGRRRGDRGRLHPGHGLVTGHGAGLPGQAQLPRERHRGGPEALASRGRHREPHRGPLPPRRRGGPLRLVLGGRKPGGSRRGRGQGRRIPGRPEPQRRERRDPVRAHCPIRRRKRHLDPRRPGPHREVPGPLQRQGRDQHLRLRIDGLGERRRRRQRDLQQRAPELAPGALQVGRLVHGRREPRHTGRALRGQRLPPQRRGGTRGLRRERRVDLQEQHGLRQLERQHLRRQPAPGHRREQPRLLQHPRSLRPPRQQGPRALRPAEPPAPPGGGNHDRRREVLPRSPGEPQRRARGQQPDRELPEGLRSLRPGAPGRD